MENPLQAYLNSKSVREIAQEAQVSSATISRITDPFPDGKEDEWLDGERIKGWSQKKTKGFIQSIVKLCWHAKLDSFDVLKTYSIPYNDDTLKDLISKLERELSPNNDISIRAATLPWEPFCNQGIPTDSWAERYLKRLIYSISPKQQLKIETIDSIDDAISSLTNTKQNDENRFDLIFGLYETANRKHIGIDFLTLPGLEVKLSALYFSKKKSTWEDFIENPSTFKQIMVINKDAGYNFIASSFPQEKDKIVTLSTFNHEYVAEKFIEENFQLLKSGIGKPSILISDANTIYNVCSKIEYELSKFNFPIEYELFSNLEENNLVSAPSFPVGIAINKKSEEIKKIGLNFSQQHDIFKNADALIARDYIELLKSEKSNKRNSIKISFPHHSTLDIYTWRNFLKKMIIRIDQATISATTDEINILKEIRNDIDQHFMEIKQ